MNCAKATSFVELLRIIGLDHLLDENRITDLTLMYNLFSRVKSGLVELCTHFNQYIKVIIK